MRQGIVVAVAIAMLITGCSSDVPPATTAPEGAIAWRPVGSWSGRGNTQTESFIGETGIFRVHWETIHEDPAGQGIFRLTIHSAISGRPLATIADQRGTGKGVFYVNETPRTFHAMVESSHVDWTFRIEEAGELGP
jgi:hypothetical protein